MNLIFTLQPYIGIKFYDHKQVINIKSKLSQVMNFNL